MKNELKMDLYDREDINIFKHIDFMISNMKLKCESKKLDYFEMSLSDFKLPENSCDFKRLKIEWETSDK